MNYASVCSGIECVSVAWRPLGFRPVLFSEVEAFPRAVLEQRQGAVDARVSGAAARGVPLWGDFTALRMRHFRRLGVAIPDALIGGTPCQSFSIAGLRRSLADDRGNLALQFVRLANAIDNLRHHRGEPGIAVWWENVPGVLSTRDNAFGCFLGALVGADAPLVPGRGQRWTGAGLVAGPRRAAAWRVLDAQYFGLAQRRARVFVVASPGDGEYPATVLFEPEALRRRAPPRREAGQDVAGTIAASAGGSDENDAADGRLIAFGGNNTAGPIETATALRAKGGTGHGDFESETFIAHALRADGFDASEDGTGRGTPLVPVAMNLRGREGGAMPEMSETASMRAASGGSSRSYVAFSTKDHGADAGEIAPTLRAGGHAKSHANGGAMPAVASVCFAIQERAVSENPDAGPDGAGFRDDGAAYTLEARSAPQAVATSVCLGSDPIHSTELAMPQTTRNGDPGVVQQEMRVRRLMPVECERLQGLPDGYTAITYRGKQAADGPRYRAIGNGMAVPVIEWLGRRHQIAAALLEAEGAT